MRHTVALAGVALMAVLAARYRMPRELLWQAFPACLLAFVPRPAGSATRPLIVIAIVACAGILLTATHDGGAQWGPRFLLIASPALLLLTAEGATAALAGASLRTDRAALVAITLVASCAVTRLAYRELRGTKNSFERIVAETRAKSKTGDVVVSGVWWYDQVVAALYGTRIFLYLPSLSASDPRITALGCADGPSDTISDPMVSFETLNCGR